MKIMNSDDILRMYNEVNKSFPHIVHFNGPTKDIFRWFNKMSVDCLEKKLTRTYKIPSNTMFPGNSNWLIRQPKSSIGQELQLTKKCNFNKASERLKHCFD